MPINFHGEENRLSYANRKADQSWIDFVGRLVEIKGKKVLEIGCGGGIYCKAMAELGAASVTGEPNRTAGLFGYRKNRLNQKIEILGSPDTLLTNLWP